MKAGPWGYSHGQGQALSSSAYSDHFRIRHCRKPDRPPAHGAVCPPRPETWPSCALPLWSSVMARWFCVPVSRFSRTGMMRRTPFRPRFSCSPARRDRSGSETRSAHGFFRLNTRRRLRPFRGASEAQSRTRSREMTGSSATDGTTWDDEGAVVCEELGRLPDRCREAVVLCDLEGLTQEQAAQLLGLPAARCRVVWRERAAAARAIDPPWIRSGALGRIAVAHRKRGRAGGAGRTCVKRDSRRRGGDHASRGNRFNGFHWCVNGRSAERHVLEQGRAGIWRYTRRLDSWEEPHCWQAGRRANRRLDRPCKKPRMPPESLPTPKRIGPYPARGMADDHRA